MRKALRLNFLRLRKSPLLYLALGAPVLFALIISVNGYFDPEHQIRYTGPYFVFQELYLPLILIVPLFCLLFIGGQYQEGAIRTRLAAGISRTSVFLANFITCAIIGMAAFLLGIAAGFAFSIPLFGTMDNVEYMLLRILQWLLLVAAFAAVFTMAGMLMTHKTKAIAISFLLLAITFASTTFIWNSLNDSWYYDRFPRYYTTIGTASMPSQHYSQPPEDGQPYTVHDHSPPDNYIPTEQRVVFDHLMTGLLMGQVKIFSTNGPPDLDWLMALYCAAHILLANGIGLWFFRRKDVP